ncbi:MAG: bifunctional ADP-dependent NAD(P)H-hydrate dehydratase/NAD(P)H-hydrate epimerase, partial [Lachnospiraceae bacterium]|nr:bifunctional ADP-dependent NAD(P)H-hydrate dehydratase/NAD(P)H-hydrate epimerase [Lachnospiraceae bacterium]
MKYVLKAHEMKAYDRDTSERIGIPSMVLMERAALAAVDVILRKRHMPGKVLIVAGMGNNGGDGLAIGRLLALRGVKVTFFMAGDLDRMS